MIHTFHERPSENLRAADLLASLPSRRGSVLDVGSRDGYVILQLLSSFDRVTALDLVKPEIVHDKVDCVEGNATALQFANGSFDLIVCAEVLEHLPGTQLPAACQELIRVSASHILVGVPYRQDLRCGRTLCQHCGHKNPPWGHVNSFDQERLLSLFKDLDVERLSLVGKTQEVTNPLSTLLLDVAGNPYGTYEQEEPCTRCGKRLIAPPPPGIVQRALVKGATILNRLQQSWTAPRGNWIHVLFRKRSICASR